MSRKKRERTQMEKEEIKVRAVTLALITDAGLRSERPAWANHSIDDMLDLVKTVLHLEARYVEED